MGSRPAASEYVWMWEARKPITVETLLTHTPREGVKVMGYEGLWDKGGSATDKRPRVR